MTFISKQGPTERLAELIGMLGTAGFMGTVIGALLGDVLLGAVAVNQAGVWQMFIVAGLLGLLAMPFAWAATWGERRPGDCPNFRNENGTVPLSRPRCRPSSDAIIPA